MSHPRRTRMNTLARWTLASVCLGCLSIGTASPASSADDPPPGARVLAGLALDEALRDLEKQGLRIVWSDRFVLPSMRVEREPESTDPRGMLDELLAAHGLRAEARASGTLVVLRDPRSAEPESSLDAAAYFEESIVVRSSEQSLLREQPVAPLAMSRSDIEILPHLGGDLFRALSLLPGLTSNDVSAAFSIHGGRRDEVQVILDGQELFETFHLADFDSALSIVSAEWLDQANLSTGGFPARRGDRMSGVLDMTTTSVDDASRTDLSLSLLTATAGRASRFADGRGHWLATARLGSIELANRLLGSEDPRFWDLFAKAEYRIGDRNSVRAHLLRAEDALDFLDQREDEVERLDTDYVSNYLWLSHQLTIGRRFLVESRIAQSRIDRDRFGFEDEEEQAFEVRDLRDLDILGFEHTWLFGARQDRTFEWGVVARRFDARYDYRSDIAREIVLDSPAATPNGFRALRGDFRGDHLGLWSSARLTPLDPLTLEIGLRFDRHTLTDDSLLSPRVSAAWRLADTSVLRASWGHFHQSHRANELQIEDGETRFFRAERSEHWVLGFEHQFGGTTGTGGGLRAFRIEAYQRRIRDPRPRFENLLEPINRFPEAELDRIRIEPESSLARGIEIAIRGAAGRRIDWWMNYAYATVRDRIGGGDVRRRIDQPHTLNADVNVALGRHWNLNLAARVRSGWLTTPVMLEIDGAEEGGEVSLRTTLGPLNSQRLPTYHRLDLRASRRWQRRNGTLTFFVDIQNVYDRQNLAGFDLALDTDEMILEIDPEEWTGILPSVGLRWSF